MRRARAISAVLRPASVRRVSATRAGNGSAGWQHVKISRSRSSGISSSGVSSGWRSSTARSRSLSAPALSRRSRSVARLRAAVVSQAPGLRGTPSRGHVASAAAKASCAQSSARSQSPVIPITVATT